MFTKLMRLFFPFKEIAQQLRRIADLYETELAERKPPIILRTERPKKSDTTVSYMGDEEKPRSALKQMLDEWNEVDDDAEPE